MFILFTININNLYIFISIDDCIIYLLSIRDNLLSIELQFYY